MRQMARLFLRRGFRAADYALSPSPRYDHYAIAPVLSEQFAYGHVNALLRYAGLPERSLVWGYIPHSGWGKWWKPHMQADFVGKKRSPLGASIPQFMWNNRWATEARARGGKHVYAIGAPWLYVALRDASHPDGSGSMRSYLATQRTLFVAPHSIEGAELDTSVGIEKLRSEFPPETTDVLLSWLDFLDVRIRTSYEALGYKVFCAGFRSNPYYLPWGTAGGRSQFLETLFEILTSYTLVVSNLPCTALLYALSIGKETLVDPALGQSLEDIPTEFRPYTEFLLQEYSWLSSMTSKSAQSYSRALHELGVDSMLSAVDLEALLSEHVINVDQ